MTQKAADTKQQTIQQADGTKITINGNQTIIERPNGTQSVITEPEANGEYPFPKDTFWHAVFGAKTRKHDSERVYVNASGDAKHFAREVECIARGEHLNAAFTAREARFTMIAEHGARMKELAPLWTKQFRVLKDRGKNGQATREEYNAMLRKGTAVYKEQALSNAKVT